MASGETTPRTMQDVDRHVGAMVRAARRAIGVSQAQLADALGVTFQQIQKYEDGTNRLSSSKLFAIAKTLNTPLSSFFEGLEEPTDRAGVQSLVVVFLDQPGAHDLMSAVVDMKPQLRARLVALAKSMSGDEG